MQILTLWSLQTGNGRDLPHSGATSKRPRIKKPVSTRCAIPRSVDRTFQSNLFPPAGNVKRKGLASERQVSSPKIRRSSFWQGEANRAAEGIDALPPRIPPDTGEAAPDQRQEVHSPELDALPRKKTPARNPSPPPSKRFRASGVIPPMIGTQLFPPALKLRRTSHCSLLVARCSRLR